MENRLSPHIQQLKDRLYVSSEKMAEITDTITAEEQARREYSRAWNLDDHGDYREYMGRFKM